MQELLHFSSEVIHYDFGILFNILYIVLTIALIMIFIYDRYIQRSNQILINYPVLGRMRYIFYMLRDPMRQYFGDEKFYDSHDKVSWVEKAAHNESLHYSFSPSAPPRDDGYGFKHTIHALNIEEVKKHFSTTFGANKKYPFVSGSIIGRSAMSDGSISPEGTMSFAQGAKMENFPINTGEGGLTTNFLRTHRCSDSMSDNQFLEIKEGTWFAKNIYHLVRFFFNTKRARDVYANLILESKSHETYMFDLHKVLFYRINWKASLKHFPDSIPEDIPDIIFQMGSALFGVRGDNGKFDDLRYEKVMRLCRMTEIKLAQGAKQTGGKLPAAKVSDAIAYYRGVPAHKDIISPNRFPYAKTTNELLDFVAKLQKISQKPVGLKMVISDVEEFETFIEDIKKRADENLAGVPDFITLDGKDGGSGAAPLEMMTQVGLPIDEALHIAATLLKKHQLTQDIKIIASEKVLTPDDVVKLIALGADFVAIARGFMMSAGCIRARVCSGAGGHDCPVGLATQNTKKRELFLTSKSARTIANYHHNLVEGVRQLLAIMGLKDVHELSHKNLTFSETRNK